MNNRYSFCSLFSEAVDLNKEKRVKIDSIVIPKIQRPYAQGRQDSLCTYIRHKLIRDLFISICKGEIFELNFIYGIIRQANNSYIMELLDGQQRLTTLFLLHWYIVNRELPDKNNEFGIELRNCLSKFYYETRSTSTVFCKKLSHYSIDLTAQTPKCAIKKAKWYFKSFDRDSTIGAMLTMLDTIHEYYNACGKTDLHKQLSNIQFYVKSLGFFNLSEELYIKMNARGLQLSPFENFKADLTNFVKNSKYDSYKSMVSLFNDNNDDMVEFKDNFSIKLDAKWIDLFWKKGSDDFDKSYMSFFTRFFASKYIVYTKGDVSDNDMRADETLKALYTDEEKKEDNFEYLGFQKFDNILTDHPELIISLDKILDVFYEYDYKNNNHFIRRMLIAPWERDSNDAEDNFYCSIKTKMTQVRFVLLGATIEFIDAYDAFDPSLYQEWMRIVWNTVENTNIDGLTPVSSLIRKFSVLIQYIVNNKDKNFFQALSSWDEETNTDRQNRALAEEILKAKRIAENSEWKKVFIEGELHPYFKGMIFFYKPDLSIDDFSQRLAQAKLMFDKDGISPEYRKNHILIRSIISQFISWGELHQQYITERSENNKYLKNILASNEAVRNMLIEALGMDNIKEIKEKLNEYITNAEEITVQNNASEPNNEYLNMAINRLHKDIKLYNWMSEEEKRLKSCFRIHLYEGHIMVAIPYRQYAKVALDTERAKIAKEIVENYKFSFQDENQLGMYNIYQDCFGNELWISQKRKKCEISIGFSTWHQLHVLLKCNTQKMAKELINQFEECELDEVDPKTIIFPTMIHYSFKKTYKKLAKLIEAIFDIVPEE